MNINYQIPLLVNDNILISHKKIINQLISFIPNLFCLITSCKSKSTKDNELYLRLDEQGLAVITAQFKPFYVKDIYTKINDRASNFKNELLYKSIKLNKHDPNNPIIIYDLTAGFGRDTVILASYATQVLMFESNPLLASLLNYAINNNLLPSNIELVFGDCFYFLAQDISILPDVIYFDPMFSDKKSAKSKKDLQIIQQIHNQYPTPDRQLSDEQLLALAIQRAKHKVVVKRDNNGKTIAIEANSYSNNKIFKNPNFSKHGSSIRYDIYLKH